jgi:hypothetical protein
MVMKHRSVILRVENELQVVVLNRNINLQEMSEVGNEGKG